MPRSPEALAGGRVLQEAPWTQGEDRAPSRVLRSPPSSHSGRGRRRRPLCPSGRASWGPCLLRARLRSSPPNPRPVLVPAAGGTPVPEPRSLCSRSAQPGRERGTPEWPSRGPASEARGRKAQTRGGEGLRRPGPKPEGRARGWRPGTHGPQHGSGLGAAEPCASVRPGRLDGCGAPALDTLDGR